MTRSSQARRPEATARRQLLGRGAGVTVRPTGPGYAGVAEVLSWPRPWRRAAARVRAERYPWHVTIAAMPAVHGDTRPCP
ncbi:MAG TPA: hypothetical protein VH912_31125 [Streptosporangiaceae bacterium]